MASWRRRRDPPSAPDVPSPTAPTTEPLSEREQAWLASQIATAGTLAARFAGEDSPLPSLAGLDETLGRWRETDDPKEPDVNTLVNALGVTFGEHLRQRLHLRWVIADDGQGSDLALHGQPGDIVIHPANAIAKRIVAGERNVFVALYAAMCEHVEELRRQL